MTIVQTITSYGFIDAFHHMGRSNHFSYAGFQALYDWLEEYSEDTGEPYELDVIGLCCDFAEYDSLEEIQQDYPDIDSLETLREHTVVLEFTGGLIIGSF
jgi:hypothetical protein